MKHRKFTEAETAAILGVSKACLRWRRYQADHLGPEWVREGGRILYQHLDSYVRNLPGGGRSQKVKVLAK